jgi:hypothetical protein
MCHHCFHGKVSKRPILLSHLHDVNKIKTYYTVATVVNFQDKKKIADQDNFGELRR